MKIIKLCALVLTAAMLLSLVTACSTNNGPAESPAEESSTVPADASTVSEDASAVSEDAFGTDSSTEAPERVEFEGNARVNVNKFLTVFAKQCFYAAPSAGKTWICEGSMGMVLTPSMPSCAAAANAAQNSGKNMQCLFFIA